MNVTLPPKFERFVEEQVRVGRFRDATDLVAAALEAMQEDSVGAVPVYPPGSLLHLYGPEHRTEEARTASASSLQIEDW